MAAQAVRRQAQHVPRRLILRPGSPLLRRDAGHIVVGPVVLRDEPGLGALLRGIDGSTTSDDPALTPLVAAGALLDASDWPGGIPRAELHCAALTGREPRHLAGRRSLTVALVGGGASFPLLDLLERSGVRTGDHANAVVTYSVGEPARESCDPLLAAGTIVLPVVVDGALIHVGPLVVPGRSPCLRCLDAGRRFWDPAWPALVTQFGHSPVHGFAADALRLHEAAGFVAAELLALGEGRDPLTVGTRVTLDGAERRFEPVAFDPECPCHLQVPDLS
jgi:hypothetical protein